MRRTTSNQAAARRRWSTLCWLVVTVLSFGLLASASTITVTMSSNINDYGGPTGSGVYYYPYVLSANGVNLNVACDDYYDSVYLGESWQASVNTFADLSGTLFYNGGAGVAKYQEAAWLFTQFESAPFPKNNVNAAINYAIWDLFENAPGYNTANPTSDTSSTYWLNQAAAQDLSHFDFSHFIILTPVSWSDIDKDGGTNSLDDRPQEYIGEVPEPATLVLLITGLAGLGLMEWKRRKGGSALEQN